MLRFVILPLILSLPSSAAAQPSSSPADYFSGLLLESVIPTQFSTGQALALKGQLADPSPNLILFRFNPIAAADTLFYFIDPDNGRFERTIVLDHFQAGTYSLEVFAGQNNQGLPFFGRFDTLRVLQGEGAIQLPIRFFSNLILDTPLPTSLPVGQTYRLTGRVDTADIFGLRIVLRSQADGSERFLNYSFEDGRFLLPFRLSSKQIGQYLFRTDVQRADGFFYPQGEFLIEAITLPAPRLSLGMLALSLQPDSLGRVPLFNQGEQLLELKAIETTAPFEVVQAPDAITPGGTELVELICHGTGGDQGELILTSNDPLSPRLSIALTGLDAATGARQLRHLPPDQNGLLSAQLDFNTNDYVLALYSAQVDPPDTGATYRFSVGGALPIATKPATQNQATPARPL
jgi:hypothetical protein